jgi:hypothetical protein
MAEEKNKPKAIDQETVKPTGGKREELSEKDLDKAAGGGGGGAAPLLDKW